MVQGMEKAVIILSTAVTRAGSFVSDARRLNVALTRAKRHLVIVGEFQTPSRLPVSSVPSPYIESLARSMPLAQLLHSLVAGTAPTLQQSGPALQQIVSSCRNATNAFWPDGRLLLPLPVALQAAAIKAGPPTVVNPGLGQPPASSAQPALYAETPSNSLGEGGTASQAQRAASAPPSPAAAMADVAVAGSAHKPAPVSGTTEAAAASHGGAAPFDDPDVPCFDLGI